jgi:hypothetical protein
MIAIVVLFRSAVEPKFFLSAPTLAPRSRKFELRLQLMLRPRFGIVLYNPLKTALFDLNNRIKIYNCIYKNFFIYQAFCYKISSRQ